MPTNNLKCFAKLMVTVVFVTGGIWFVLMGQPTKNIYFILPRSLAKIDNFSHSFTKNEYSLELSTQRINKLFDILLEKEKKFLPVLTKLNVLIFDNLINGNKQAFDVEFNQEKKEYLKIVNSKVEITDKFIEYLYSISNKHSLFEPRKNISKFKLVNNKFDSNFMFRIL